MQTIFNNQLNDLCTICSEFLVMKLNPNEEYKCSGCGKLENNCICSNGIKREIK